MMPGHRVARLSPRASSADHAPPTPPTPPHPTPPLHPRALRLSNSQGNLLDDTQLIDVLAVTKQTAQDVSDRLANASETNKKINDACEEYRAVGGGSGGGGPDGLALGRAGGDGRPAGRSRMCRRKRAALRPPALQHPRPARTRVPLTAVRDARRRSRTAPRCCTS